MYLAYLLLILKLFKSDEESSGVSALHTGEQIGAVFNATDSVAGTETDKEFKEISVAFAF